MSGFDHIVALAKGRTAHVDTIEKIKEEYFKQMRHLLCNNPEELRTFEKLWAAGRLREAYIFVMQAIENFQLKPSPESKKADEDFFWMYMH